MSRDGEPTLRDLAGAMAEIGGDDGDAFASDVASRLAGAIAEGSFPSAATVAADVVAGLDALIARAPREARDVAHRSTARTPDCEAAYVLG